MKLKLFQRQDLARAALHDGLILSWDTGLGKTWATFLWPLLKVGYTKQAGQDGISLHPNAPVLIIAPGDLHAQIAEEGAKHFHAKVTPLPDQATFQHLARKPGSCLPNLSPDGRPVIPAGFYITSYTQLATNGVQSLPDPDDWPEPTALLKFLCLPVGPHQVPVGRGDRVGDKVVSCWPDHPSFQNVCEFFAWRGFKWGGEYNLLGVNPDDALEDLEQAFKREMEATECIRDPNLAGRARAKMEDTRETLSNLMVSAKQGLPKYELLAKRQQDFVLRAFLREKIAEYEVHNNCFKPARTGSPATPEADAKPVARIKCCYSPSLADLCYNAFDCVCIDEGVKMKGEDTLVGKGVRAMTPKYRLILTATPVKNRLPDIFRLAWWASGGLPEAHARWPYADDSSERGKFAETFMVSERNLTKEDKARQQGDRPASGRFKKLTAEVCNVHRLWKLLGPIVLRRRKQDAGEDIVPRIRRVIRCDLGTLQHQVYQYHLQADYRDVHGQKAVGAQLQALRMAAADPSSEHLQTVPGHNSRPCPDCKGKCTVENPCARCQNSGCLPLPHRSGTAFIPKMATTLTLVQEILARQEQVVVFSAFNDPLDNLGRWLAEASVRYIKLDGRVSQKQRGKLAAQFKSGRGPAPQGAAAIPVMLAGVECMAEGHSFHLANNVILIAYSWAFDKFVQALNRVHRMTSTKPVNVYVVLCAGTIDRKLESLIQDKGDAAELVLDGRLIGERTEEVNLAELLKTAHREFVDDKTRTIDEGQLHQQWGSTLRPQLQQAMVEWDQSCGVWVGTVTGDAAHSSAVKALRAFRAKDPAPTVPKTSKVVGSGDPVGTKDWRVRMIERARKLSQRGGHLPRWSSNR